MHPGADAPVSIVIPTYNRAALVGRALASVPAAAGAHPYEIIVVDDCSGDLPQLRDLIAATPGVRLIEKPRRTNAAESRNIGFSAAHHDFVFFLDSDDEFRPGYIDRRCWLAAAGEFGIMFGDYADETEKYGWRESNVRPYAGGDMRDYIFRRRGSVVSSTLTVYRPHHRGTLFDPALAKHQDWAFAIAAADRSEQIGFDPEPGVVLHGDDPAKMSSHFNPDATAVFVDKYVADPTLRRAFLASQLKAAVMLNRPRAFAGLAGLLSPGSLTPRDRVTLRLGIWAGAVGLFPLMEAGVDFRARLRGRGSVAGRNQ